MRGSAFLLDVDVLIYFPEASSKSEKNTDLEVLLTLQLKSLDSVVISHINKYYRCCLGIMEVFDWLSEIVQTRY
jgi:predicted metal-dependent TIM-barrel fold hydrolase